MYALNEEARDVDLKPSVVDARHDVFAIIPSTTSPHAMLCISPPPVSV